MTTDQEFAETLARGYETQGIEFKGSRPRTDKLFFAKVARAVMGMANRRDGGRVIIGIDDEGAPPTAVGLCPEDLETWRYDDVAAALSEYADPNVSFDLECLHYQGNAFVILHVHQFSDVPILCSKDYPSPTPGKPPICRRGACYVRSTQKPETSEIPSQEEMRELLDLATDIGVRKFISRLHRVGLADRVVEVLSESDADRFDKQLGDLE